MLRFVSGQLLRFILLMIAVSMVSFLLVSLSPIDPVQANVGQVAYLNMSEAKRAQLVEYWGANTPVWERYVHWATDALQGDLGTSLRFNAPVTQVIGQRFANSAVLMATAWLLGGIFGLLLGIVAAVRRDRWLDRAIKAYSILLASTPTFWLALLFLVIFSVWLGIFPLGFSVPIGMAASEVTLAQSLHHLILPALTLSVVGVANIALHTREKTIDVLQSDYVRFARSRGASMPSIIWRHGLRNLALPALTLQFASISEIFGGSVLVEQVFSYPGLGQAAVTAGLGGDAALLVGITLASTALVFCGNLIANLLYSAIDPRIRPWQSPKKLGTKSGAGEVAAGGGDEKVGVAGVGVAGAAPVPVAAAVAGGGGVVAGVAGAAPVPVAAAVAGG
ncbi:MAG: ABC transporter permease, partial [Coriobacteriales bacterium]|nr:ABC transporter permease [Coriobacteriales bacterium]